jgi:3-hydroxyacyl-CoA dehydrogenase
LGEKSGQGFYKRVRGKDGSEILVLDPTSMEYRPRESVRFDSIGEVRENPDPAARIRGMVAADDRAARFARPIVYDLLAYSACRVPEIADSPADVDAAMRWGFAWALGPFQTWDVLGVDRVARALEEQGTPVPDLVREVLESGQGSFYRGDDGTRTVFTPANRSYAPLPPGADALSAASLRRSGPAIAENRGAALLDMGDGVALLEYRTKLNTIDENTVALTREALDQAGRDYRAIVIGNDAADFSAGANLALLLMAARMRQWAQLERIVKAFQDVNMAAKYSPIPVVVAAAGRTLAGGCEVLMHCARAQVAAETYCGLVETGVGLIPAGGGCKELLLRARDLVPEKGPFPAVRFALEIIAYATVSTSAAEARRLGYLRRSDGISLDRERLLSDAKAAAIALAEGGYRAPEPATLRLPGVGGRLVLDQQLEGLRLAGKISEHDAVVTGKLAHVLCGGDCSPVTDVSEQHLLDLEREAFISLCGMPKTQERIQHTLNTGKPLRN